MQKVMLIGNLGRDPEVKYSQQGTAIAQFSVATTERWKDRGGEPQEHTEWFAVKAFNRLAEIAGEKAQGSQAARRGGNRLCSRPRRLNCEPIRVRSSRHSLRPGLPACMVLLLDKV